MGDQSNNRAQLHYSTSPIQFNFIDITFLLRNKTMLREWLSLVCKQEGKKLVSLSYNFCSDKHLLKMNREHLKHDYFTDIITFELSENKKEIEGDIYISVDRVRDNAKIHGVKTIDELHRVMVHGLLHLCGYGDKTPKQEAVMRKKEDECLSLRPSM